MYIRMPKYEPRFVDKSRVIPDVTFARERKEKFFFNLCGITTHFAVTTNWQKTVFLFTMSKPCEKDRVLPLERLKSF